MAPPGFVAAAAYGTYTGELREMLQLFKFHRISALAPFLSKQLAEAINLLPQDTPQQLTLIAVPLSRDRYRQRGYNQSVLLADELQRQLRRTPWQLTAAHNALIRIRQTETQFTLSPRQRRLNLRGAFKVANTATIAGRHILLIDDIYTTGATARECSRTLLRAGAASVRVLTLARAQRETFTLWNPGTDSKPAHATDRNVHRI